MKKSRAEGKIRDLEKEREELLKTMAGHISVETQKKIDAAIESMDRPYEYRITISKTGAADAND